MFGPLEMCHLIKTEETLKFKNGLLERKYCCFRKAILEEKQKEIKNQILEKSQSDSVLQVE